MVDSRCLQRALHGLPRAEGQAPGPIAYRGSHLSYAVTEGEAGSDPSGISTIAKRDGDGWLLSGEKWFVTSGDMATAHIVVARTSDDANDPQTTLFLVDADLPGISVVEDPMFTHAYPHGHPTIAFDNVRLGNDAVLGEVGGADDLQRAWFVEERLAIAARCVGAMERLLEEATAWALQRATGWVAHFRLPGSVVPAGRLRSRRSSGALAGL